MIISHEKKFIYIAVPKTGTKSIHRFFRKYNSIKRKSSPDSMYFVHGGLDLAIRTTKHLGMNPDDYFSFSCVRNPWDRCVSEYFFIKKRFKQRRKVREYYNLKLPSFREWLMVYHGRSFFANHDKCQWDLIQPDQISYIVRFEDFQKGMDVVCDKIGVSKKKLPRKNQGNHVYYTTYYDEETREIVAQKYAKDIEYFGYKFGE